MNEKQPVVLPFYARLALTLLAVVLIVAIMYIGKSIIIPLFFSLLIALMLLPLVKLLERWRLPRSAAAMISLLLFVAFLSGIFYFLGQQIAEFTKDLPKLGSRMQSWLQDFQQWISGKYHVDYSRQIEYMKKASAGVLNTASSVAQLLVLGITNFVIWMIFIFIFTFFTLVLRPLLVNFITCLFMEEHHPRVMEVLTETKLLANSYVLGLLIEMVIVAVLNCSLFFIFGIRYALLLGVLAAVFNIIPYLGIYSATALAAIITLSNSTPNHALIVIIILVSVHVVDGNILMPRIVGARVKMNPLITILAVLIGHLLWGIPGMFLFIPLAAMLKIIFERVDGLKPFAVLMGTSPDLKKDRQKEKKLKVVK